LFAISKKDYFLVVSAFLAAESATLVAESANLVAESAILTAVSDLTAAVSVFASVLELLLQAAKAPIAKTKKNFFMLKLFVLIEWFPVNTLRNKK
jgi:hypothetical protein